MIILTQNKTSEFSRKHYKLKKDMNWLMFCINLVSDTQPGIQKVLKYESFLIALLDLNYPRSLIQ